MIITTTEFVPGYEVTESLGIVTGSTVRAKHIGSDIAALFKNIAGGEIKSYTDLLDQSRKMAIQRMIDEAERLGADAVIGVRFSTSSIMQGAAEILAFGTAVKLVKREG